MLTSLALAFGLKKWSNKAWSLPALLRFSMRVLHVCLLLLLALKLGAMAASDIVSNHVVVCIAGASELRSCAAVSL